MSEEAMLSLVKERIKREGVKPIKTEVKRYFAYVLTPSITTDGVGKPFIARFSGLANMSLSGKALDDHIKEEALRQLPKGCPLITIEVETKCNENLNVCNIAVPEERGAGATVGCYEILQQENEKFFRRIFKDDDMFAKVKHLTHYTTTGYLYEQMIQQHRWLLKDSKAEAILKEGLREWVWYEKLCENRNSTLPYFNFSFKKWITEKGEEWWRRNPRKY